MEDTSTALRALVRLTTVHVELGDLEAFDNDTDRMIVLARTAGHPALTWRPLLAASCRALAHGDFDESERLLTEVEQAALLLNDPALTIMLQAHKAYRTFALDDDVAIRDAQAKLLPIAMPIAGEWAATIRATFAIRLGDRAAAAAEIPAMARFARKLPPGALLFAILGEAAALAGTTEEREAAYEALFPFERRHVHTGPIPQSYEGPCARVLGLLEASLGRLDEAARASKGHARNAARIACVPGLLACPSSAATCRSPRAGRTRRESSSRKPLRLARSSA